jgi:hypothetical protein
MAKKGYSRALSRKSFITNCGTNRTISGTSFYMKTLKKQNRQG